MQTLNYAKQKDKIPTLQNCKKEKFVKCNKKGGEISASPPCRII